MPASAARFLHPANALTYLSLLAGLLAVAAARERRSWPLAGALIALSALADTLDGRFARLFRRSPEQARFGMELDSLADAVTFGVAPAAALYLLVPFPSAAARLAWGAAAFAYVLCAVTRLGAYNLEQSGRSGFVGLPTTVAGLLCSSLFLAEPSAALSGVALLVLAVAMVARIEIPRPRGIWFAAFLGWGVLLIALHVTGVRSCI